MCSLLYANATIYIKYETKYEKFIPTNKQEMRERMKSKRMGRKKHSAERKKTWKMGWVFKVKFSNIIIFSAFFLLVVPFIKLAGNEKFIQ